MSKKLKALLILLITTTLVLLGYYLTPMFNHTGEKALENMTEAELEFVQKASQITSETSLEEVYEILGTPQKETFFTSDYISPGGSPLTFARLMHTGTSPRNLRFMKIGKFIYEIRY